jgi:catechol 2,3-dioxygenase-like lactoylglutathione lyase family enzyme
MLSRSPVFVTLPVRGLAAAQRFYSEKLGLKRLHGSVQEGYLEFAAGRGTRLQVFTSTLARKSNDTAATFEVTNLVREMTALRKKGVVFEEYDLPHIRTKNGVANLDGMGKGAWLKDPSGNLIGLHESS